MTPNPSLLNDGILVWFSPSQRTMAQNNWRPNNWKPIGSPVTPPPSSPSSSSSNKVLGPGWTRRPNKSPPDWDWIPPIPWTPTRPTPVPIPTTTDGGEGSVSEFNEGDVTFVLVSSALVLLMIPGLGFFYSGLTRSSSALSLILICFWSLALVSLQWFVIGYSLTFSAGGSAFIGNFEHLFLSGVVEAPAPLAPHLPGLLFALYQGMFAAITPALIFGGASERFRFLPATLFIPLWTTFVYDPLAYWSWNPNGWGTLLGGLDFAGGTPVHISSGAAALAYALVLGKRVQSPTAPHNMSHVLLGTALLWFGWFGFNGGSALSGSSQAVAATLATHLAACSGGVTGLVLNYCSPPPRTYSALGFCSGAVAGLVCITPAAGFVSPASSLVFGLVGGFVCHVTVRAMSALGPDDALEVFGVHGVGGIVGNILTGVFAEQRLGAADGGGLDGNWKQVLRQLADTVAGFCWSFVVTLLLLLIINVIPGMKLRLSEGAERVGTDHVEHGEGAYAWVDQEGTRDPPREVWIIPATPPPPIKTIIPCHNNNCHASCCKEVKGSGEDHSKDHCPHHTHHHAQVIIPPPPPVVPVAPPPLPPVVPLGVQPPVVEGNTTRTSGIEGTTAYLLARGYYDPAGRQFEYAAQYRRVDAAHLNKDQVQYINQ